MPGAHDQTIRPFLWRATNLHPGREIVSRTENGVERYGYAEYGGRVAQLANALEADGLQPDDRVGTFCWNHYRHFETYFGVPNLGAQLHTINPLLPDEHIEYIVENANDRLLFVDPSIVGSIEGPAASDAFDGVERFVIMGESVPDTSLSPVTDYESFIEGHDTEYDWPELPEEQPAGMCYTSGTTGRPKGVEYTQQMLWAHTMATLTPQGIPMDDDDVVMPVVPMFHVNAWGLPYCATAAGAKQVFPGPSPDPPDIACLIEDEGVTITASVPTVWLGLLEHVRENDVDLSSLDVIVVGGSAVPESMLRTYEEEFGVDVLHAWGMTETTPVLGAAHLKAGMEEWDGDDQYEKRVKQGLVLPGIEFRVVDDAGDDVPWNGESYGELWVRGPWVTTEYFARPAANQEDFEGDWLKTGDIVTVDDDGYIKIVDRTNDVIKSGGEWISSVELENGIMAHSDVSEATVIGVAHERWGERPVACVVPVEENDKQRLREEVQALIEEDHPKWWVPDEVVIIDEAPKTATGKFDKKELRETYGDPSLLAGKVSNEAAPEEEG